MSADMAEQLLTATKVGAPHWVPGTRPAHHCGIVATGHFHGSTDAWRYCGAKFFGLQWTDVIVRFSNSSGQAEPDWFPQIRGMAVKFKNVIDSKTDPDVDLICMTLPIFVSNEPEEVMEFGDASKPTKVHNPNGWQRAVANLKMNPLPPAIYGVKKSASKGVLAWAKNYRKSHAAVAAVGIDAELPPPQSYGRQSYHAVHAFEVKADDGTARIARFTFEPSQGVAEEHTPTKDLADDYLRDELGRRLAAGPVRFTLRMQIADQWDDPTDPTVAWPTSRREIVMGTLVVTGLYEQDLDGKTIGYNVGRLPDQIQPAGDKVMDARVGVYNLSQEGRGLGTCPFKPRG